MASSIETTSTTTTLKNNGNTYMSVDTNDVVTMNVTSLNGGQLAGNRNKIINGDMSIWQRGTTASYSVTSTKYDTADRWLMRSTGTSDVTTSQQSFTVGQTDVPNNPKYFYRWNITSWTASTGLLQNRIEDVASVSGGTYTLSFWAKCSAAQDVTPSFIQYFGSGGSTSVTTTNSAISLSTSWQKFTSTVAIPSVSGKTISGGNDYLAIQIAMPAAVSTVDIALVQLEAGTVATPFEHRSYGTELALCQRYCFVYKPSSNYAPYLMAHGINTTQMRGLLKFPQTMRSSPSLTFTAANTFQWSYGNVATSIAIAEQGVDMSSVHIHSTGIVAKEGYMITSANTTSSSITGSAEL